MELLTDSVQFDSELCDNTLVENSDLHEIQQLQGISVWGESQEILEIQALKELEVFSSKNASLKNVQELEDGEIPPQEESNSVHEPTRAKPLLKRINTTLDINCYIKKQEELKKRQEYKRSLLVSERSKNVAKQISKQHCDQTITDRSSKRKAGPSSSTKVKILKVGSDDVKTKPALKPSTRNKHGDSSGSEYLPSDDDISDNDCGGQNPKFKLKKLTEVSNKSRMERVVDDGCLERYNLRLDEYYKELEYENSLREVDDTLPDGTELVTIQGNHFKIPAKIWNNLYRYQQEGVEWLWNLHQQSKGGLLGDEMGLGKTVQIIAFLTALRTSRISSKSRYIGLGPTLIVSPATVIHQWVKHFHDWSPEFRVAVLHQSGSYTGNKTQLIKDINKDKGILITTYLGILKYKGTLCEHNWHYVILDEGHKIRNPGTKVSVAIKEIHTPHRIMLTGSPMQNNLQELWSLFDFFVPGMLGSLQVFMEHFANPIMQGGFSNSSPMQEATALSVATALKNMISPYLLRRSKNEVRKDIALPDKSEQVLFCSLTAEQRDLYKGFLMGEHVSMILGRGSKNWFSENHMRANVLVAITTLRKICNHPDLYLGEADSHFDNKDDCSIEESFGYYKSSGKMVVVSALLKIWKRQKHRVLLFTQSRGMIRVFEIFLNQQGYKYLKMDGSTSIGARQPLINKFNQDTSYDVFVLTTRVGGLGVNLTGASRVIIYDPDWNPATDTQARERAWRIGQEKQVTVYRLISAGTIEEKMYQRQVWKQLLSNKVLLDPRTQKFFKTSDLHDLFSLQEQTQDSTTETANIFQNSRINLQERINEKKHKNKKHKTDSEPEASYKFSDEKIQAMKNLAQQIAKNINKTSNPENQTNLSKTGWQKELEEERKQKLKERQQLKTLTPTELRCLNKKKLEKQDDSHINQIDDCQIDLSFTEALSIAEKTANLYTNLKNNNKVTLNATSCSSSDSLNENVVNQLNSTSSNSKTLSVSDSSLKHRNSETIRKHKKKEKSNHKHRNKVKVDNSGQIDGEVVEGLLKREIKRKEKNKKEEHKSECQDQYVLDKLFSKKGVHTALQHDVIVQSGYKDRGRIEIQSEAQKKADLALNALRKSRVDNWRW